MLESYLGWLRDRWKVELTAAEVYEHTAVDPEHYSCLSPLGGTLKDHAAEMILHEIQSNPSCIQGKRVWEIGCGEGTIAVTCALSGAREVWATDVDTAALQTAAQLADRSRTNVRVESGDLLSIPALKGCVDLFIANLPQKPSVHDDATRLWDHGGRDGTDLLTRFLEGAADRLEDDGQILYQTHSLAHPSALRLLQTHFDTKLLSWRKRIYTPGDAMRERAQEDLCWLDEEGNFIVLLIRAGKR